jgi:D-arginine dehydrogenase
MTQEFDFAVIGAGMAGSSIAAHLSEHASVHLLEMEDQPGYHSTGRSAAIFAQSYGNQVVRELTRASRPFFYSPPPAFCSTALVKPRSVLITARTGQEGALQAFLASTDRADHFDEKSADEAVKLCPILRRDDLIGAVFSRSPADIEVHELQRGYLRMLKARNGLLTTAGKVLGAERIGDIWTLTTAHGKVRARNIVNAAGAWAGEIGTLLGAQDIDLRPLKRTACLIDAPVAENSDLWPMLLDVEERFYLKPDAGKLLLSPADETLTEPCDAQPDELDIAIAVDRLENATTLQVGRIASKWAGLRSFVQDRTPVVGYDAVQPGFFWLAALGGYGIQTAPALSRLAASLALRKRDDEDLLPGSVALASLRPDRFLAKVAAQM